MGGYLEGIAERIGVIPPHDIYLLNDTTSEGLFRITWGLPEISAIWTIPKYRKWWGTGFNPDARTGSVGFADTMPGEGIIDSRTSLTDYLLLFRMGIKPKFLGRGLSTRFLGFIERHALSLGYSGLAVHDPENSDEISPPLQYRAMSLGYEPLRERRSSWLVKPFEPLSLEAEVEAEEDLPGEEHDSFDD